MDDFLSIINKKRIFNEIEKYDNNHYLLKIAYSELILLNIENYKYNRPADQIRIQQISDYIKTIDTLEYIFYMVYDYKYNNYYIYDGNHRFNALKLIYETIEISTRAAKSFLKLKNKNILINLLFIKDIDDAANCEIINNRFLILNKSVSVPDLYFQSNLNKNKIIENILTYFKTKYTDCYKLSNSPSKPNFNTKNLTDLLDYLYDKYDKEDIILVKLFDLNTYFKDKLKESLFIKCTKKQYQKSLDNNLFLFLFSIETLKSYL
jgi:hypothetical protein